jgi:hypothetical protein
MNMERFTDRKIVRAFNNGLIKIAAASDVRSLAPDSVGEANDPKTFRRINDDALVEYEELKLVEAGIQELVDALLMIDDELWARIEGETAHGLCVVGFYKKN